MIKAGNILIKNIYYMLCYAFKNLDSVAQISSNAEDFENMSQCKTFDIQGLKKSETKEIL